MYNTQLNFGDNSGKMESKAALAVLIHRQWNERIHNSDAGRYSRKFPVSVYRPISEQNMRVFMSSSPHSNSFGAHIPRGNSPSGVGEFLT